MAGISRRPMKEKLRIQETISGKMRKLWEEKRLVDYTIVVENQEFQCHKVVLAAASVYFEELFSGKYPESSLDRIVLESLTKRGVETLIHYMYTGKLEDILDLDNVSEILECASHLQIEAAVDMCRSFLCADVNLQNCGAKLNILRDAGLTGRPIDRVEQFIFENCSKIVEQNDQHDIPYDIVKRIVPHEIHPEWTNLLYILSWIKHDLSQRRGGLNRLMSKLSFYKFSATELRKIQAMDFYTEHTDGKWKEELLEALNYYEKPIEERILSEVNEKVDDVMKTDELAVFTTDRNKNVACGSLMHIVEYGSCVSRMDYWHDVKIGPLSLEINRHPSAIAVNGYLIVAGGQDPNNGNRVSNLCYVFDGSQMTWLPISGMLRARMDFPLVEVENVLYALGGSLDKPGTQARVTVDCEMFNFNTREWSTIPPLKFAVRAHAAVNYDGKIYVSGGRDLDRVYKDVQVYDVQNRLWSSMAPMLEARHGHSLFTMRMKGEKTILAIGPNTSMEYFVPSHNQWTRFSPKVKPGESYGVAGIPVGGIRMSRQSSDTVYFVKSQLPQRKKRERLSGSRECGSLQFYDSYSDSESDSDSEGGSNCTYDEITPLPDGGVPTDNLVLQFAGFISVRTASFRERYSEDFPLADDEY